MRPRGPGSRRSGTRTATTGTRTETILPAPKVLQIGLESPWGRSGGLNRYLAELMSALHAIGIEATAVSMGERAASLEAQTRFRVVASNSSSLLARLVAIRREVFRLRRHFDLVDVHFALSGFAVLAGPLRGRPLVVHFQGPWADESAAIGQTSFRCVVKRWVERRVYRRASAFVVLSSSFRRILIERYAAVPWDITVMAPGVDTDRFRPGDRSLARVELGVPCGRTWVAVSIRRLVPRMGLDVLVDAWNLVVEAANIPVLLLIAGDGPTRSALEAQVERLGLTDYIRFIGQVDDASLVSLYRAANVSVVPSVSLEGYGLVVLESLSTGTPVVASAVGGLSEAVGGFDESALVPPSDPHALAERLIGAMRDTIPLPSESACRRYAEGFSWAEVARRHADLYRRILSREASPTERSEERVSRPVRVVVIGHTAQLSGGELAISRLISSMDSVDVHVVLAEDGPLVENLERAGATVEVLPMAERARNLRKDRVRIGGMPLQTTFATIGYTIKLARRLRRLKPDVVHTNTLKSALYGGVAARAVGIPCLWHVRDRIDEDYLPRSAVIGIRVAARFLPTEVVANSRTTLETLRLQKNRRGRVVYDGVVTEGFGTVGPKSVNLIYGDSGEIYTPNRFRVAMVGRLSPWKGQDVFLKAFAEAFVGGPEEAVLVGSAMFGEEKYEGDLVQLVAQLGICDQVEFRGFQPDVSSELGRVDVIVHASVIPEPFGQVVIEGMAAGLAVVASDAGGPAEIVTHEVDGLLYPLGNVAALAVLLRRLARDPKLRHQLGYQAARTAEKYKIANEAAEFVELYQLTVNQRGRRFGIHYR
jgi:glycosyltransferase involved in cell wall biosynthesis